MLRANVTLLYLGRSAVHSTMFTGDGLRVMAGSDDGVVRSWDMATSKHLFSLRGATDYVRAQAASPASKHIWATGSYDRRARIYDLRTRKILFTLEHGSQIDDLVLCPGGAQAITVGGTDIKVWDFFAGGKLVANLHSHAKAVTCCALSADGDCLLTGGLDGYVKVHDWSRHQVISSMAFDSQVLSLAVAPKGRRIAVGLVDGTIEFRSKKDETLTASALSDDPGKQLALLPRPTGALKERLFEGWGRGFMKAKRRTGPNPGSLRYYMRGQNQGPTDDRDVVIAKRRRSGLGTHDVLLRKFRYGDALDSVLSSRPRRMNVTHSVLLELIARNGLRAALGGRDAARLVAILAVICKNIAKPRYTAVLVHLADIVLDMYGDVFGGDANGNTVDAWLIRLRETIKSEIGTIRRLCQLQGMLAIVGSATAAHH
jgi:U3 small nucleolar RNA-associated protein 15